MRDVMGILDGMSLSDDELRAQLAFHEAGHAVAAVQLAFTLRFVAIRALDDDEWMGETSSTAADIKPTHPDSALRRHAAVVAMAGREGRRLRCPDLDAEWRAYERSDLVAALQLVRAVERDAHGRAVAPNADAALATLTEDARLLLDRHRSAVEAVAACILERPFPTIVDSAVIADAILRAV